MREQIVGGRFVGTHRPDAAPLTLDRVIEELRLLRSAAGHPSYAEIAKRIGRLRTARGVPAHERVPARATVYDCFRTGRRRLDVDLVVDVVQALGQDPVETARWRQMCVAAQHRTDAAQVVTAYADLPASVGPFVGRSGECVDVVTATADSSIGHVVAIEGMPGSGKSYLAAHIARRLRDSGRIDDVLYVDLRGYHHEAPPADQGAVLEAFLRLLGVPGRELPTDRATRHTLFQSRMGERRFAIILDDAASTDQVTPLLPDSPGSIVLITSRLSLDDQRLAHKGRYLPVPLDVFSEADAMTLLRRIVGTDRVNAEPAAATDLVAAVGCLPLAVSVTATRVAGKPTWSLVDHLESLVARQGAHRLDDRVQATLELSYAALSSQAREILRLLAVQPCTDLDSAAIASLADADAHRTLQNLNELARQHLVEVPRPDRYALHALIRTYAWDRSWDDDRPADRTAAVHRLAEHVVDHTWHAYDAAHGDQARRRRAPAGGSGDIMFSPAVSPDFDEDSARRWLESNVDTLLTLAGRGHDLGKPDLAIDLSEATAWWLNRHGRYSAGRLLHRHALDAARALNDAVGETNARLDLGQILVRLSDWEAATEHLTWAGAALERSGDLSGALSATNALAIAAVHDGRMAEAIEQLHHCLRLARAIGNPKAVATVLDNLAITYRRIGRLTEALEHHRLAYEEAMRGEDRYLQASGLINMADVQLALGAFDDALHSAHQGLEMSYRLNNMVTAALGATNIGSIHFALGDYDEAIRYQTEALELIKTIGERHLEASITTNAGHAHLAVDHHTEARRFFEQAHEIATTIGDSYERARAVDGLAHLHAAEGDENGARQCWVESLAMFEQLGAPEAADVRTRLTELATTVPPEPTTV